MGDFSASIGNHSRTVVGIAAVLFVALWLQGSAPQLEEFTTGNVPFAERLMVINAGLAVFNLLPAFPVDGGRVLRALLAMRIDYVHATERRCS